MENKKHTAVWWLAEQLFKDTAPTFRQRVAIEEARKMEKEQIENAFVEGDNSDCLQEQDARLFARQYYNETYGTE